jgi:hypothetical protein
MTKLRTSGEASRELKLPEYPIPKLARAGALQLRRVGHLWVIENMDRLREKLRELGYLDRENNSDA